MAPTLYMSEYSPPVRAVLMTAKALGITLEHKDLDLSKNDHLNPEYLKINPQHTIPTLVDDGTTICDSHAIITYLVGKYGKDDSLYPKDLSKRAVIDQRLHFDSGILFAVMHREIVRPMVQGLVKGIPSDKIDAAHEAYDFLEKYLGTNKLIAGDDLTVADISCLSTLTSLAILVPIGSSKYPKTTAWIQRLQTLPWYSENVSGLKKFEEKVKNLLNKA